MKGGWVRYPIFGSRFVEVLPLIVELLGSSIYEWRSSAGRFWIRRVED